MYSVTTLCLYFCIFSESLRLRRSVFGVYSAVLGENVRVAGVRRGLSTSEYMTQHPSPATPSYAGESNSLAYDGGILAEHRSSRPRTCNCPPYAAGQQVNGYRPSPASTCCPMQQWPSTIRRTMPPWPTPRTAPLCATCWTPPPCSIRRTSSSCITCRTLPPCTRCQTLPPCAKCHQTLPPPCTTCRILPPCTTCRTLPPCTTCRTVPPCTTCRTLPPCTTCRTLPPCTTCRTVPPCTTCRTQPPCTTCRTLPPCTTCRILPPCTTCRTPPPCMKCRTTRPLLVVRVEIPERPCYTPMPCDTPSARGGGYENAWSDNTPPSAIICHPSATTTRRPCRQPISHHTKCPYTSMIPAMQPCNCKLRC